MNNILRFVGMLMIIQGGIVFGFGNKTFFGTRSQAVNTVRELAGWQQFINQYDKEYNYGVTSLAVEYNRSFSPQKIADFLLGGQSIRFSGSRAENRGADDTLADYFGLAPDFKSCVRFIPRISNVIIDFNWYQGIDAVATGVYYRIHVPIVHTKWDLDLKEFISNPGTKNVFHPAGYMAAERVTMFAPSVQVALQGKTTFGDMREPLQFGKVFGRQTRSRVAELQGVLGWNFLQDDWYHFGFNIRVAAPTGNSPAAEFLFEPIVGNGHHWELGGGLTSHVVLWENKAENRSFAIYVDANVTHLFSAQQKRSFDLKNNGPGSRYILLTEILSPANKLQVGVPAQIASNQYQGRLVPAINKTTLESTISIAVQADVTLKFSYRRNGFETDIGYNFWGHSKEKLEKRDCFQENRFGVKGDAQVYGFNNADPNNVITTALNVTQRNATSNGGQGAGNAQFTNANADNPAQAFDGNGNPLQQLSAATVNGTTDPQDLDIMLQNVQTSNPAILLRDSDIDDCSALLPRAISNKLFGYVSYVWDNGNDLWPYLGGGLSVEWGSPSVKSNSAHSQWAIWLKGGLSY